MAENFHVNIFLFLAYSFVWLIFVIYVWVLARRQAQLRKELARLSTKLREVSAPDPSSMRR